MTKAIREIKATLQQLNIASARVEKAAKHIRVTITGRLGQKVIFASATASDWRNMRNLRSEFKSGAKAVGAI